MLPRHHDPMEANVHPLGHQDWDDLDRAVQALHAPELNTDTCVQRSLAAILSLVPGEFATYSRATTGAGAAFDIVFSTTDQLPLAPLEAFMSLKDRYRLWHPDFSGAPAKRSDFFSDRQFRDQPLYTDAYRPFGLDNHLCIPLMREGAAAIHFSVQRHGGADFTERDRAVIARLQPHLVTARLLALERPAGAVGSPSGFQALGLTPRECDVFHWLVEGKRNAEIATILRLQVQTVKGHVAAIFQKLHVENRHSAIRIGIEALRLAREDELLSAGRRLRMFNLRRTRS